MAVVTALAVVVLGLVAGIAGDFLMLLTSGIAIGAWIASGVVLLVEWRRRGGVVGAASRVNVERYLLAGGLSGGAIGLAVAIADLMF